MTPDGRIRVAPEAIGLARLEVRIGRRWVAVVAHCPTVINRAADVLRRWVEAEEPPPPGCGGLFADVGAE